MKISNIQCLLLDKRIEERSRIKQECSSIGWDVNFCLVGDNSLDEKYFFVDVDSLPPKVEFCTTYPTWHKTPNAYNAWLSHRKMIMNSLDHGKDHILILEDDITIESDFKEIWDECEPWLDEHEWDMIYFGAYHNSSFTDTDNYHIKKLNGSAGWHAVLLNETIMKRVVDWDALGPFDWMSSVAVHPNSHCYGIWPSIVSQRSGYSYVEGGDLKKPSRYHI